MLTMLWACKTAGRGVERVWVRRVAWGMVSEGRLGTSEASCPQGLVNGLFKGYLWHVQSDLLPFHALWESYLPLSLSFSTAPRLASEDSVLCWCEREVGLFGSILHSWRSQVLTHMFPPPAPSITSPMGGVTAEKGSPGPRLCCLRRGCVGKVRLFHLPSPMCPEMDFFFFSPSGLC